MCACDSRETEGNKETWGREESIEREEREITVTHTHNSHTKYASKHIDLTPRELAVFNTVPFEHGEPDRSKPVRFKKVFE